MGTALEKEWKRLLEKEERMLCTAEQKKETGIKMKIRGVTNFIEGKIPEKVLVTLNHAFYKAFVFIFDKGTEVIEKTFCEEELNLEFQVNDFRLEKKATRKSLRKLERSGKNSSLFNSCVTTVEGIGLGAFGIGVPDIPIFLGMLLKGIYETATSYGFDYHKTEERIFILRMICAGLADGTEKRRQDKLVEDCMIFPESEMNYNLEEEIKAASAALSDAMLTAKFIQGIPVAGIVGGMSNPLIYRRVLQYVGLKYKKRYLAQKRKSV